MPARTARSASNSHRTGIGADAHASSLACPAFRDKRDKTGRPIRTGRLQDRSLTHKPANSGQFASRRELSGSARVRGGGCSPIRTGLPAIFKMQGDSAEMQGGARARAGQKATFTMGCRIASLLREQGDLSLPAGTSREGGEKLTNQGMTVA